MKLTVAAAIATTLAIAATTASAGVVITQKLSTKDQSGKERKFEQTVMVQGHKQKVITGDREVITDLDAGKIYVLKPSIRAFIEGPFPPKSMLATMLVPEGIAVGFNKTPNSHKQNGYACQDYAGASTVAHFRIGMIECVASDAPGAKEYAEFQRLAADKLKGTWLAQGGAVPDGIPVSSIIKLTGTAMAMTGGISPEKIAKLQAELDKKPTVTGMNISKIEAKDLPADTFTVPANYIQHEIPKTTMGQTGQSASPAASPAPPAKH